MKNGEPAFPSMTEITNNPDFATKEGMSLRDYFAAKAMSGMLSNSKLEESAQEFKIHADEYIPALCKSAYEYADAMLKARRE